MDDQVTVKDNIILMLNGTGRPGIACMIDYMITNGFFEAPASQKFHGCYVGGLAAHSLSVLGILRGFYTNYKLDMPVGWGQKPLSISLDNITIAALLHDVCKVGAYVRTKADDGWTNVKGKDKGHGALSVTRVKQFIELEPIEEMMIRFHMGLYHAKEYDPKAGEYHLLSQNPEDSKEDRYGKSLRNAWYHNPIVKALSIADELATFEEKSNQV